MGIDITTSVEVRRNGKWELIFEDSREELFARDYSVFGFLAGVNNYSRSPVIAEARGLPGDASAEVRDSFDDDRGWSDSWLTLAELLAYDYDQVIWDRRIERETAPGHFDGAALAEEGEGEHLPLRDFLGTRFFKALDMLKRWGDPADVRIVFWFG